ncbi:ER membrane protein complex subunit 10 [Linnemannia exigua]|uniref:ER membrane protein complex subunit 10 n=1 Tax=Linnemannia exigua TaxID=604196 RepID=A0AAD4D789_9FUNG|nr:ER membrane protein complex subunit 10 [Linnemannia exigua]
MRLNTFILALTLAASAQVYAEEVTLGVWHKLSDHESFEKRGEIRFDPDQWHILNQQRIQQAGPNAAFNAATAANSKASRLQQQQAAKQKQQTELQLQNFPITYENIVPAGSALDDFVLNVRAPVKVYERDPKPTELHTYEDGITETQEEFDQRLEEWTLLQEELDEAPEKTPGTVGFYQIMLKDESRGWQAMSSIKSCLLVASDFQERIALHLDQDRKVFAFDYYTTVSECSEENKKEYPIKSLEVFKDVKLTIDGTQTAPKSRFHKAQAIKVDETGKPEAEKTFFQKYWVYIMPAIIIFLFAGGEPEKKAE